MPRVKKGAAQRQRHKKVLKAAKGFYGAGSRRYRNAIQLTLRSGAFASRDRRDRKRDFRGLWITRISAACNQRGIKYSRLIAALDKALILINRKMLSEIAIADPKGFDAIVEAAGLKITRTAA